MPDSTEIFDRIYADYLQQIAQINLAERAPLLGCSMEDGSMLIPLFGRDYRLSDRGIAGPGGERPMHAVNVVLCKYVLLCPASSTGRSEWVSYRDFRDAAPFAGSFSNNVERALARNYAGRAGELRRACGDLGGREPDEDLSYEVVRRFTALPRADMLLLFNDADEEFPAECSVLFDRKAADYLDMECLAILGWLLSDWLHQTTGDAAPSIM